MPSHAPCLVVILFCYHRCDYVTASEGLFFLNGGYTNSLLGSSKGDCLLTFFFKRQLRDGCATDPSLPYLMVHHMAAGFVQFGCQPSTKKCYHLQKVLTKQSDVTRRYGTLWGSQICASILFY